VLRTRVLSAPLSGVCLGPIDKGPESGRGHDIHCAIFVQIDCQYVGTGTSLVVDELRNPVAIRNLYVRSLQPFPK
jgi:hypothetical protein